MAKEEMMIKRAFIAGAAAALSYKEKHPNATESEVMSDVNGEMRKMIKDIEDNE